MSTPMLVRARSCTAVDIVEDALLLLKCRSGMAEATLACLPGMLEVVQAQPECRPFGYKEPDWRQWCPSRVLGRPWPAAGPR